MIYRAIGLMSGSSLDGLDIAFAEFEEARGVWSFQIKNVETLYYDDFWKNKLSYATELSGYEYVLLDNTFGRFIGNAVNHFIDKNNLHHQVQLIASHGHTVFHSPEKFITTQIGSGAQIAALTNINVVSDLRSLDVALGGQGAPIVPLGEKYLFKEYHYFLNIGGIANLSIQHNDNNFTSFDVCVANQALNYFAEQAGMKYDEEGNVAASGNINEDLLSKLNVINYYKTPPPKSLSNQFFKEIILPAIAKYKITLEDILRTYVEHIAIQIKNILSFNVDAIPQQLLITGGGAFNKFLVKRISENISSFNYNVVVPENNIVEYKEALIMAFIGIMRWREENTILPEATGASRASIGGAVWIGQEY